ncbi:MAG: FAD:protein FMN transferase [Candidatus Riesia sp.]|nr:FAD:protein FMN transferase [Candidatus Riesia sp.]
MTYNINRRTFLKNFTTHGIILALAATIDYSYLYPPKQYMCLTEKHFETMGTIGKIQLFEECKFKTQKAISEALKRIFSLEKELSKFNIHSEISKLNRNPFFYHATRDDTVNVLEKGIEFNRLTNGYFDFGLGNLLSIAGIDPNIPLVGTNFFNINSNEKLITIKHNKVKINRSNSMLDLGGIAKGYIIDEAIKIFKANKIKHVALEIGGDIKVYGGTPNNKTWHIILNNGASNDTIKIHTGSISISGGYIKKSVNNINNITHHIVNPKDLKSKNYYTSIIVYGENSIDCDILATALYNINSKDEIKNILKKIPNYEIKYTLI